MLGTRPSAVRSPDLGVDSQLHPFGCLVFELINPSSISYELPCSGLALLNNCISHMSMWCRELERMKSTSSPTTCEIQCVHGKDHAETHCQPSNRQSGCIPDLRAVKYNSRPTFLQLALEASYSDAICKDSPVSCESA